MRKNPFFHLLLFLFCFCGCEDKLNGELSNQETSLSKDFDFEHAVAAEPYESLAFLQNHWSYLGLSSATTDESLVPSRSPGNHWGDNRAWYELCAHEFNSDHIIIEILYKRCQTGVLTCNKWIATLHANSDKLAPESYSKYIAELRVLRSYYYYVLLDCFGQVYFYDENLDDSRNKVCSSWEAWKELVVCIETELSHLPWANTPSFMQNYGRVTKGMAYTLLARLYLNAASFNVTPENCGISTIQSTDDFYTHCVQACNHIINASVYQIEADYYSNFASMNETSRENIFVIVNDPMKRYDAGYHEQNTMILPLLTMPEIFSRIWNTPTLPWNGFCATTQFLSLFTNNDKRGLCNFDLGTLDSGDWGWLIGPVYDPQTRGIMKDENGYDVIITPQFYTYDSNYNFNFGVTRDGLFLGDRKQIAILNETFGTNFVYGEAVPDGVTQQVLDGYSEILNRMYADKSNKEGFDFNNTTWYSGARSMKYKVSQNNYGYRYFDNDFVIFRYADVLYMKAEAILRGGEGNIQAMLVNADFRNIRTRVNMPAYTSLDLDELIKERGREFVFENVRRRDLIRFGLFTGDQYLWGIKNGYTDEYKKWFPIPKQFVSMGMLRQNPGY